MEEATTTVFAGPGDTLRVDAAGNFDITLGSPPFAMMMPDCRPAPPRMSCPIVTAPIVPKLERSPVAVALPPRSEPPIFTVPTFPAADCTTPEKLPLPPMTSPPIFTGPIWPLAMIAPV